MVDHLERDDPARETVRGVVNAGHDPAIADVDSPLLHRPPRILRQSLLEPLEYRAACHQPLQRVAADH
jgi:hypothetical protein